MDYLFYNCNLPEEVDLSGFRMDSVTTATGMFASNPNVKYVNVDGVYAPNLGWKFFENLLTTATERIDFSNNETPMYYEYYSYDTWGSRNLFDGYTNLRELKIPHATLKLAIGSAGRIFNDAPLESLAVGKLICWWYNSNNK